MQIVNLQAGTSLLQHDIRSMSEMLIANPQARQSGLTAGFYPMPCTSSFMFAHVHFVTSSWGFKAGCCG